MYLRPDEVARVLEKVGFTVDVVTQKAYGYRRGEHYVYVNREARMGRTALVIHPTLKSVVRRWQNPLLILKPAIITSNFRSTLRASDTSITVFRMVLVRVLRLNVICMACLAKPIKDATGIASREKKSQAFTCW